MLEAASPTSSHHHVRDDHLPANAHASPKPACYSGAGPLPHLRFLFEASEQKCLNVSRNSQASDDPWPKFQRRRGDQFARQGEDMQVVVEVTAAAAMLRPAGGTRMTFPIMTDAAQITPAFVGEENVGAEIDSLTGSFEPAPGICQSIKIDGSIDRDQNVGVVRDCLCRRQRSDERYFLHARTVAR